MVTDWDQIVTDASAGQISFTNSDDMFNKVLRVSGACRRSGRGQPAALPG